MSKTELIVMETEYDGLIVVDRVTALQYVVKKTHPLPDTKRLIVVDECKFTDATRANQKVIDPQTWMNDNHDAMKRFLNIIPWMNNAPSVICNLVTHGVEDPTSVLTFNGRMPLPVCCWSRGLFDMDPDNQEPMWVADAWAAVKAYAVCTADNQRFYMTTSISDDILMSAPCVVTGKMKDDLQSNHKRGKGKAYYFILLPKGSKRHPIPRMTDPMFAMRYARCVEKGIEEDYPDAYRAIAETAACPIEYRVDLFTPFEIVEPNRSKAPWEELMDNYIG